jgi:hypothetical protein
VAAHPIEHGHVGKLSGQAFSPPPKQLIMPCGLCALESVIAERDGGAQNAR